MSNPGDTGEAIATAMGLGAQTALMDEAWWLPAPKTGRFGQSTLDQARQRPRTIYVDAAGRRFVQRVELVHGGGQGHVRARQDEPGRPVLADLRRPLPQAVRPRALAPRVLPEADVRERAAEEGVRRWPSWPSCAASTPTGSSRRSSTSTSTPRNGVDPDYGRGESAYNRSLGDPHRKVHPCLGPIDEAPYYACEVLPGDIGTCGGLVTDEHARVLDQHDRAHRGALRHRQQHRHGHGPPLPRPGGEHRQHDGVRVPRGATRCHAGRRMAGDRWLTSSRARSPSSPAAASGLGRAMVERFAEEGARVVIADIDAEAGEALAAELGDAAAFQQTDVTDADQVQALVDSTVERFGGLHVMVEQRRRRQRDGPLPARRPQRLPPGRGHQPARRAARLAAGGPPHEGHGGGSIINISSTAGLDAGAGLVTYRATKAAVIHATRSIALDVAQYGIRVNCLVPGQIRTAMTTYDMDPVRELTQPLPREGQAEDVAEAALFLASDRSAQITGVVLPVDGGTTAGPPAGQLKLLLGRCGPTPICDRLAGRCRLSVRPG